MLLSLLIVIHTLKQTTSFIIIVSKKCLFQYCNGGFQLTSCVLILEKKLTCCKKLDCQKFKISHFQAFSLLQKCTSTVFSLIKCLSTIMPLSQCQVALGWVQGRTYEIFSLLILKRTLCFAHCAPQAQSWLKTPRLDEAKLTTRGGVLGASMLFTPCAHGAPPYWAE